RFSRDWSSDVCSSDLVSTCQRKGLETRFRKPVARRVFVLVQILTMVETPAYMVCDRQWDDVHHDLCLCRRRQKGRGRSADPIHEIGRASRRESWWMSV